MNIQTLPRKDVVVKRAFLPKLDYLVFADYDQIEMRVLAYYLAEVLGDTSMKDVLANPDTDLHRESASGIFQIDREPTDNERQLGKNMNFSMVYGGGRPAVMRYLAEFNEQGGKIPVTWKYAAEVIKRFHERWPGINQLINAMDATHEQRGYLMTVAGAHLHPRSRHSMLNLVVQSSAAEVMRRAMRECYTQLKTAEMESHLVCVVHDELVFDVPARNEEFDYLLWKIPEWMDYPLISKVVPITTSIEYSDTNWAEKKGIDV